LKTTIVLTNAIAEVTRKCKDLNVTVGGTQEKVIEDLFGSEEEEDEDEEFENVSVGEIKYTPTHNNNNQEENNRLESKYITAEEEEDPVPISGNNISGLIVHTSKKKRNPPVQKMEQPSVSPQEAVKIEPIAGGKVHTDSEARLSKEGKLDSEILNNLSYFFIDLLKTAPVIPHFTGLYYWGDKEISLTNGIEREHRFLGSGEAPSIELKSDNDIFKRYTYYQPNPAANKPDTRVNERLFVVATYFLF
jgi:hypothetical protein